METLMLEAWGERKSLEDWAKDDRATANAKIIRKRFETGMPAELAIGVREGADQILPRCALIQDPRIPFRRQVNHRNARFVEAFGVVKSMADWADDYRCVVSYRVLAGRIAHGKDPEWAITTPPMKLHTRPSHRRRHLIAAFGEVKTPRQWAADSRSKLGHQGILLRIQKGMSPEDAITTPPRGYNPALGDGSGKRRWAERHFAFGEYQTIYAWRRDHRCRVTLDTLRSRIKIGWDMEDAMTLPLGTRRNLADTHGKRMTAFGETHTLLVWSQHPKCRCAYTALTKRVAAGVDLETALTAPPKAIDLKSGKVLANRIHRAFGEEKTVGQWAQDPRCRCSAQNLTNRIAAGWSIEDAITTPLVSRAERARMPKPGLSKIVTAFGQTKRAIEWAADPRARVGASTICNRLRLGWKPEDAITLGKRESIVRSSKRSSTKRITAWGEAKTIRGWMKDPRVTQSAQCIAWRLRRGIAPEIAMTAPAGGLDNLPRRMGVSKTLTAWGETKTTVEWESDPRCKVPAWVARARVTRGIAPEVALSTPVKARTETDPKLGKRITAWGETKFAAEWVNDPRCVIDKKLLLNRLRSGWEPELALSSANVPYQKRRAAEKPNSRMVTAWGETKSAERWAEDPRAGVSASTILKRTAAGMSPEEAISITVAEWKARTLPTQNSIPITSWGETKTAVEWERDARCAVSRDLFMTRLRWEWTPERAIGQPIVRHEDRAHLNGPDLEGFGEVKSLRAWIRDPRCVVPRKLVKTRLAKGWSTEAAITTPLLNRGAKISPKEKRRAA